MGSEWIDVTLSDLVNRVIDNRGKNPPYHTIGHEVIETGCVSGPDRYPNYSLVKKFVDQNTYETWFRSGHPQIGDLLLITVGNGIGAVSIMGEDRGVITQNLIGLNFNTSTEPLFIYYYLSQNHVFEYLQNLNIGSAQPSIKVPHLLNIPLALPPLPEQKAIAHILGSLDDKIELNRRMNATLEGLAQALFQSWFVDFDPVLDNALAAGNPIPDELADRAAVRRQALDNGTANRAAAQHFPASFQFTEAMGWIPKGWEEKSVGDVTHAVTKGDTPRKSALDAAPKDDRMINLLRVNAITENGEILIDKLAHIPESIHLGKSKRSILKEDYILYTNAGTIGRVSFVRKDILPANTNQAIAIIQPDDSKIPPKFLYMTVRQSDFKENLHSDITQAVQANLALGKISKALFVLPSAKPMGLMEHSIDHFLDQIWANRQENITLTKLRDTLLPQLISGELRIPDAAKLAEAALA